MTRAILWFLTTAAFRWSLSFLAFALAVWLMTITAPVDDIGSFSYVPYYAGA